VLAAAALRVTWIDSRDEIFPADVPANVHASTPTRCRPRWRAGARLARAGHELQPRRGPGRGGACLQRLRERGDLPFVGLIGSKTKWATFRHRLEERGFTAGTGRVTCPIGIPASPAKRIAGGGVSSCRQLPWPANVYTTHSRSGANWGQIPISECATLSAQSARGGEQVLQTHGKLSPRLGQPAAAVAARHHRHRLDRLLFYFVFLDSAASRRRSTTTCKRQGVTGELWAVHGGGFYHPVKFAVAPPKLPPHLHWFYWEAYTTWMSGFALFTVSYLWNAGTYLVDKALMDWSPGAAVAVALSLPGRVLDPVRRHLPRVRPAQERRCHRRRAGAVLVCVAPGWPATGSPAAPPSCSPAR
jgi:hypothetical protein